MSPVTPGRPIGQALAERWLVARCTVRAPVAGGGWTVAASAVPCRFAEAAPALATQPGGLVTKQRARIYVQRGYTTGLRRGWELLDEDGNTWKIEGVLDEPEAPTIAIDATRVD